MRAIVFAAFLAAVAAAPARAADWRPDCFSLPVKDPFSITKMFGDPNAAFPGIPSSGVHDGIDLGMSPGSRIHAMAGGRVIKAGLDKDRAAVVFVLTNAGRVYILGHLSRVYVRKGQTVRRGQIIGLTGGAVGALGSGPYTTGPHLHISIIGRDDRPIDPVNAICGFSDPPSPSR